MSRTRVPSRSFRTVRTLFAGAVGGGLFWGGLLSCSEPPEQDGDASSGGASSSGGAPSPDPSGGSDGATGGAGGSRPFAWPEGKRAAVSLTYDDGLDGQLKHAVPSLEERGLRGTFFLASFPGLDHAWSLPNLISELTPRHLAWQAVAGRGHELGSHTIHHPCASNGSNFRPEDYDQARMAEELDATISRLERLGGRAPFSFAYPCAGDRVGIAGGESYEPLVAARFFAARSSAVGVQRPEAVDLHRVSQKFGETSGATGEELIDFARAALQNEGWAVFTFHGVGPEATDCNIHGFDLDACALNYLTTESEEHERLLDYLIEQDEIWVAPFGEVARHLAR